MTDLFFEKIKNQFINLIQKKIKMKFWGTLYYFFARHLPYYTMFYSLGLDKFRNFVCKKMVKKCGEQVKFGQGALIGSGNTIEIGDYSIVCGNPAKVIKYRKISDT